MILVVYFLSVLWGFYHADLGVASKPLALLIGAAVLILIGAFSGQVNWPWRRT